MKQKVKKQNPVDKGQSGLVLHGTACKYCGNLCFNEETLSIHINNEHVDRQSVFQCAFCGLKSNEFRLYAQHLEQHSKDMYKCYTCNEQFASAHDLRVHVATHINQCPLCSRTFESLLVPSDHVNTAHGAALAEEKKRCLYCDAAFDTFNELCSHSKEGHHHYFCDICFAGFVSEPLFVEHRVNNHPTGCSGEEGERAPSTPGVKPSEEPEITITKVTEPELEKVIEVIHTPEPDPFPNKWHPAVGQVKWDSKKKVECEECHRYLKSNKLRVEHIRQFHPLVLYDCKFFPGLVIYTTQDLVNHCQKNHSLCDLCSSAHRDEEALQAHNEKHHKKAAAKPTPQPAPKPVAVSTPVNVDTPEGETEVPSADDMAKTATDPDTSMVSKANICPNHQDFTCGNCKVYYPTRTSFKIHLTMHKKVPCPFCPQTFFDTASRDKHVLDRHQLN